MLRFVLNKFELQVPEGWLVFELLILTTYCQDASSSMLLWYMNKPAQHHLFFLCELMVTNKHVYTTLQDLVPSYLSHQA